MGIEEMKSLNRSLLIAFIAICFLAIFIPIILAVLWSLVDPNYTWNYPDLFPREISFGRWAIIWQTTTLKKSMINSYSLGISVTLLSLILSLPTAAALGRYDFKGKNIAQVLILLPMVIPGFVIAIFFTSFLYRVGIYSKFIGILIGHTVLNMPFAIRILTVSFSQVRDDLIEAARDLGASKFSIFKNVFLPAIKPGILSSLIIVMIRSLEEFALAYIIGSPDFTTIPTILYSYLGYQFIRPNAAVVSIILVFPNVILMLIMEKLLKTKNPAMIVGKG